MNGCIGKAVALAFRAAGKQDCGHAAGETHADRRDVRPDVLHGVVNGQTGIDNPTWAVYVHEDVAIWILAFEEEQLRGDQRGDRIVDRRRHEDETILEHPRVNIEGALAAVGRFDNSWDDVVFHAHFYLD